ncbi:MAG: hypothetical protein AAF360_18525 [Pseudomonadota bacterium]
MPQRIEDVSLSDDIASREGMSLDHIARSRISFLIGQNNAMVAQTQFADAKAGALLAFVGLIATRGPDAAASAGVTAAGAAQFALHVAALILCIYVLYPRYATLDQRRMMVEEERFSWPALAADGYEADTFADFMHHAQISQLVVSIARSNHALSRILLRKYAGLRAAFVVAIVDVAVLSARVVTGL